MKIAVAALGENEDSEISQAAGRAPFFIIFEEGKAVETVKNPFRFGSGGAGVSVAKMLADKGVEKIVAGKFGPNMAGVLEERNIACEAASGKAIDALKE